MHHDSLVPSTELIHCQIYLCSIGQVKSHDKTHLGEVGSVILLRLTYGKEGKVKMNHEYII